MDRTARLIFAFILAALAPLTALPASAADAPKPTEKKKWNVLWILGDDLSPDLGCYGDPLVKTPNLDKLAEEGVRFTHAFTTAPVCSASRSALITGMWQTSIGAQNHRRNGREKIDLPKDVQLVTDHFRKANYWTANVKLPPPEGIPAKKDKLDGGKTDFNFRADKPYDGSKWEELKDKQPFFAQVNFLEPHRGPVWRFARQLKKEELVDPAKVKLPPYYPDTPKVRDDWANYLDSIHLLDIKVGALLDRLKKDGLADNTIIFFFGDNGRCHLRDKQWLYDNGLHIPLIVRWPGQVKPGTVRDDLVSAIDITATSLKLAGIDVPKNIHGQVFLGPDAATPRKFIIGARDRCDETVDRIRSVRTHKYNYIKNFMPERPYTQANDYKEKEYPTLNIMKELHKAGKLTPEQALFMAAKKPAEELYDMKADPHEVKNLAGSDKHKEVLKEMREILEKWMKDTNDQGSTIEEEEKVPTKKKK